MSAHIYIYVNTWNLFVLYFWASTLQNKGHLGSRYIYFQIYNLYTNCIDVAGLCKKKTPGSHVGFHKPFSLTTPRVAPFDLQVSHYLCRIHVWFHRLVWYRCKQTYLDLPRGAEWMIRGAYTPSLGVQTAPFGRCWYVIIYHRGSPTIF